MPPPNLCFHLHLCCVCVLTSSCKDSSHWIWGPQLIIAKTLFQNKITFWGSRKDMHFAETLSNNKGLFIRSAVIYWTNNKVIMQKTFHPDKSSLRERLWLSLDYLCIKKEPCSFWGPGMTQRRHVFPREITFFQTDATPLKFNILPHISPDYSQLQMRRTWTMTQWCWC